MKSAATRLVVAGVVTALMSSGAIRAEKTATAQKEPWTAEKILPAEPGRKACWRRVYDAKHLTGHPRQKVTELTFFLRVSGYDARGNYVFKNPDHIAYNFAVSLKRRGDKRALAASGDCFTEKTVQCVVDCDGGKVTIDKLPSGNRLLISLDDNGIGLGGDCDTTTGTWVSPGADDKVFYLDPAPVEACKTLERRELGGWDDKPQQ